MNVSGNTLLITGGTSGIGLALAKKFLALENTVIVTGRNKSKLENLKKEFPEIQTFAGDLTDKNSLNELVLFIEQKHSSLNILINNAAVQYNYSFLDESELTYKINYEIAANLTAPILLTALLLPTLRNNRPSAVVNVSSGLFIAPKMSASIYCATKAAMHSHSKTLRYQLENTETRVFELIPALVETPMTEGRGKSKITAEKLVEEFIKDFKKDKTESYIGKTKLLKFVHRISPKIADRIMKKGL